MVEKYENSLPFLRRPLLTHRPPKTKGIRMFNTYEVYHKWLYAKNKIKAKTKTKQNINVNTWIPVPQIKKPSMWIAD